MQRLLFAVTLSLAIGTLSASWGATPAPMPYVPGTTWAYRHTQTAKEQTDAGTFTVVYRGLATYRGASFHHFESYSSLVPGLVERDYAIWTGRYFRQAATAIYKDGNILEIIFDKPYAFTGAQERLSGATQVFENGAFKAQGKWSITVVAQGSGKATVPAGSYSVEVWRGALAIGAVQQSYAVATVGPLEVLAEIDVIVNGTQLHRVRFELQQGPVPKG